MKIRAQALIESMPLLIIVSCLFFGCLFYIAQSRDRIRKLNQIQQDLHFKHQGQIADQGEKELQWPQRPERDGFWVDEHKPKDRIFYDFSGGL